MFLRVALVTRAILAPFRLHRAPRFTVVIVFPDLLAPQLKLRILTRLRLALFTEVLVSRSLSLAMLAILQALYKQQLVPRTDFLTLSLAQRTFAQEHR